jgi:hypothetical protein
VEMGTVALEYAGLSIIMSCSTEYLLSPASQSASLPAMPIIFLGAGIRLIHHILSHTRLGIFQLGIGSTQRDDSALESATKF